MEFPSIVHSIIDLFFPKRCLNCENVISSDSPLCVLCASELPFTHWSLNQTNAGFEKLKLLCKIESCYSLLYFRHDNVTQKLLHHLKYGNRPEIGTQLANLVLKEINIDIIDGLIPVPIHPKKFKKRGYNQIMSFTEKISIETGIPIIKNVLIRRENSTSQVTKSRIDRLNSLKTAFHVNSKDLNGHYLLIDDTITTGSTISNCVNTLKDKYEIDISILTIACGV